LGTRACDGGEGFGLWSLEVLLKKKYAALPKQGLQLRERFGSEGTGKQRCTKKRK
jgi:hypothetical protein